MLRPIFVPLKTAIRVPCRLAGVNSVGRKPILSEPDFEISDEVHFAHIMALILGLQLNAKRLVTS